MTGKVHKSHTGQLREVQGMKEQHLHSGTDLCGTMMATSGWIINAARRTKECIFKAYDDTRERIHRAGYETIYSREFSTGNLNHDMSRQFTSSLPAVYHPPENFERAEIPKASITQGSLPTCSCSPSEWSSWCPPIAFSNRPSSLPHVLPSSALPTDRSTRSAGTKGGRVPSQEA